MAAPCLVCRAEYQDDSCEDQNQCCVSASCPCEPDCFYQATGEDGPMGGEVMYCRDHNKEYVE